MKKTIKPEENEEKVVSLELLQGGKSGPGHNWLKELPIGTYFVAMPVGTQNSILGEFVVIKQIRSATCLRVDERSLIWFDNQKFSVQHVLKEILIEKE